MPIRVALKAGPKVGEKTRPRKGRQGITEKSPKSEARMQRARKPMMGGGMTMMPRAMYKKGGIAKGCGAVMSDRRKVTKVF